MDQLIVGNFPIKIESLELKNNFFLHLPCFFEKFGLSSEFSLKITTNFFDLIQKRKNTCFEEFADQLENYGVSDIWKHELANNRAIYLGNWIAPYIKGGQVLDLLCGDGAVGIALNKIINKNICLVERPEHTGLIKYHWINEIKDYNLLFNLNKEKNNFKKFDTVILCTVLHHESKVIELLNIASQLTKQRIIIIENCIEDNYGVEYQLLVDLFFNLGLYKTKLSSPGSHLTNTDWVEIFKNYGNVKIQDYSDKVPGIPLSHTLFTIDLY